MNEKEYFKYIVLCANYDMLKSENLKKNHFDINCLLSLIFSRRVFSSYLSEK